MTNPLPIESIIRGIAEKRPGVIRWYSIAMESCPPIEMYDIVNTDINVGMNGMHDHLPILAAHVLAERSRAGWIPNIHDYEEGGEGPLVCQFYLSRGEWGKCRTEQTRWYEFDPARPNSMSEAILRACHESYEMEGE